MQPVNFEGATHVLGAPKDWNDAVECEPLIVRLAEGISTSVWKPSPEDIEMLRQGAMIVLHVWGGQPPVQVSAAFVSELPRHGENQEGNDDE